MNPEEYFDSENVFTSSGLHVPQHLVSWLVLKLSFQIVPTVERVIFLMLCEISEFVEKVKYLLKLIKFNGPWVGVGVGELYTNSII